LIRAFLRSPLRYTCYRQRHGRAYFAVYRPADGVVDQCRPKPSPYPRLSSHAANETANTVAPWLPDLVQLAADFGRDDLLIRIASQLESTHPWSSDHPAIP
jgi:hypothetical protein